MRGLVVSAVLSIALLTTWAGKPFDEKNTALEEIQAMYNAVEKTAKATLETANKEKNIDRKGELELQDTLGVKINETRIQLDKDAKAVLKLAIVQSKPMTVIHCIRNVSASGYLRIDKTSDSFWEKVVLIRLKKIEKLDYDISCIEAIMVGLKELIEEAKEKIKNDGIILTIKKEASQNCHSADLLLGEIELDLHEPILSKEYAKVRQEIDKSLKAMKAELNTELQKCLTSKP